METTSPAAAAPVTGAARRGLERPTMVSWLQEIAAVVGPQRALEAWSAAALATGRHGTALDCDQLEEVGAWIVRNSADAPLRMAVRSCAVRLRTYRVLSGEGRAR